MRKAWKDILIIIAGMVAAWLAIMAGVLVLPGLVDDMPPLWRELIGIAAVLGPLWFLVILLYTRMENKLSPAPKRIKPLTRMGPWLVSVIVLALFNALTLIFENFLKKIFFHETYKDLLWVIVLYINLFLLPIVAIQLYRGIKARWRLEQSPGTATARIVAKSVRQKVHLYEEGGLPYSYNYILTLEFLPQLALNVMEKMTLEAQVSEEFYERFETGQSVDIRYAAGDPRIFLIEGEGEKKG